MLWPKIKTIKPASPEKSELDKKWELESNKNVLGISLLCAFLAVPLGMYLAYAYEIIFHPIIYEPESRPEDEVTVMALPPRETKLNQLPPQKKSKTPPQAKGQGRPEVAPSVAAVEEIFSKKNSRSDLIAEVLEKNTQDIEKVFNRLNSLEKLANSRIGDARKGKFIEKFNVGITLGISNGDKFSLDRPFEVEREITKPVLVDPVSAGSATEIGMGKGNTRRSLSEIMRTVRGHMTGLRHIYNLHLKQNPGFSGVLRVRIEISPSGQVVSVKKVGSTTKVPAFDVQILEKLKDWRFSSISAKGNDVVTIPLSFSE